MARFAAVLAVVFFAVFVVAQVAPQVQPQEGILQQYMMQLQGNPDDTALREKIIALVRGMNPPPAVPEDVARYAARGKAAIASAKGPQDLEEGIGEYKKASLIAPWVGAVYYNMAKAYDLAGNYDAAIRHMKLYVAASPGAPDLAQAKSLIYEYEYKQEKDNKERQRKQAEADAKQREEERRAQNFRAVIASLGGDWDCDGRCENGKVTVAGDRFIASVKSTQVEGATYEDASGNSTGHFPIWQFEGRIQGNKIIGTATCPKGYSVKTGCEVPSNNHGFDAEISEDGTSVTLHTENTTYQTSAQTQTSMMIFTQRTCTDVSIAGKEPITLTLTRTPQQVRVAMEPKNDNSNSSPFARSLAGTWTTDLKRLSFIPIRYGMYSWELTVYNDNRFKLACARFYDGRDWTDASTTTDQGCGTFSGTLAESNISGTFFPPAGCGCEASMPFVADLSGKPYYNKRAKTNYEDLTLVFTKESTSRCKCNADLRVGLTRQSSGEAVAEQVPEKSARKLGKVRK